MNRQLLVILCIAVLLLAGGFVAFVAIRPRPQPPAAVAEVKRITPQPVAVDSRTVPAPARVAPRRRAAEPEIESAPVAADAPAPAEPSPEVGILHIDSDVRGAQVFIDRQYIGATPVTAPSVTPGTHRLNVSAQGFEGVADAIEVAAGPRDVLIVITASSMM